MRRMLASAMITKHKSVQNLMVQRYHRTQRLAYGALQCALRGLGRYNGSLGRPEYPTLVVDAWKNNWTVKTRRADSAANSSTKG